MTLRVLVWDPVLTSCSTNLGGVEGHWARVSKENGQIMQGDDLDL
jgi:hypothetical protein